MSHVRIDSFFVSLDGYGAGPEQSLADPMGRGGMALHGWARETRTFRAMFGQEGGSEGIDDRFAAAGMAGLGAWILGRNMFTPSRGPWADDGWRGWWGEEPPYACPVFVRSHYPRPDLQVGKTTFIFTDKTLRDVVHFAREASGGRDVRIGGGVATVREALAERLVDRAHFAVSPVLLGQGEALWQGLDVHGLGYRTDQVTQGEGAVHVVLARAAG
jgi:dihydrofolate reductase